MSPLSLELLQQFDPGSSGSERAQGTDLFFDLVVWMLVILPLVTVVVVAAMRRKRTPELPHVSEATWEEEVVECPVPVVVHVYRAWSIGDRVIENQVQKLGEAADGRLRILWLDIDRNPDLLRVYPTLERRTVALFVGGRLMWQATGVVGHEEMLEEIEEILTPGPRPA